MKGRHDALSALCLLGFRLHDLSEDAEESEPADERARIRAGRVRVAGRHDHAGRRLDAFEANHDIHAGSLRPPGASNIGQVADFFSESPSYARRNEEKEEFMKATTVIPVLGIALIGATIVTSSAAIAASGQETVAVSGSGADIASEAIVHSEEITPTGMVRMLTEIVELTGDLHGKVLYQARQEFDFVANTLVVTGENVFSGTIAGSKPIILRSDESRFEVDLATGAETGTVHLTRSTDAPDNGTWYECELVVVGTGQTPEANPTFDYSGTCKRRGR